MRLKTSLLSTPAPPSTSKAGGNTPQHQPHLTPPRHRMFGGDTPCGGVPPAMGHAGRASYPSLMASVTSRHAATLLATLAVVACIALFPSVAFASSIEIKFPNGGSVYLNENGTLTGSAEISEFDNNAGTRFPVTLPDGTQTYGWCQDKGHLAPSAGSHPFVATPNGNGTYFVMIDSTQKPPSPRQVTDHPLVAPPQRIGISAWAPRLMGKLALSKLSSLPSITDQNSCYSFQDAHYNVFADEECTNLLGELSIGSNGVSDELELEQGTYWVKETAAPTGYQLDEAKHEVVVHPGQTTVEPVSDTPVYEKPEIWALKKDIEYESQQGSASLAGAEFTVKYYDGAYDLSNLPQEAARTWVLKSNSEGQIVPSSENLVRGSAFFYNENNEIVLPLGTISIQETKAPLGYWLEGQNANSPADYEAPIHVTSVNGEGSYGIAVAQDPVKRAGILVQKADSQTGTQPQGDASFEGIGFSIVNRNNSAVIVNENVSQPGETVATIYTNDKGIAQTPADYLPLGTYEVMETAANESMLLTCESQTITLNDSHTNQVVSLKQSMPNGVVRGGVKVGKVSRETGQHLTQGEAQLGGAVFAITADSPRPVVVNGATYQNGDVVCTLTTNEDGVATTDDRALPYGTYTIREDEPPAGFLPNQDWSQTIQIREDGVVVDVSDDGHSADDQVMRGAFSFNKVDESSMERMSGIPWLVTSVTTGEKHVVVSDENGIVDTEATPHGTATNANDQALQGDVVKPEALNPKAGVWFSGRIDVQTEPNNALCALPYDIYTVEELRCEANKYNDLIKFTVRIHEHDVHLNMGTIDNKRAETPSIGTTLTYDQGDHVAPTGQSIQLVDNVLYSGLKAGEEYVVQGELHYKDTGSVVLDANEEPVVSSTTFTPAAGIGSTKVTFELNSSNLAGKSVVAYEYLFYKDEQIAEHANTDDEDQTVYFPTVDTSLADAEGYKEVRADQRITLVDTVSYSNVVPHVRYEVEGILVDKETSEALVDATGQEIHASASFVPVESEGSKDVAFNLSGSLAAGKSIVAFEVLRRTGIDIASHQDLDDEEQTINVPSIQTNLADQNGQHVVNATESIKLTDTITYQGLEPGATYTTTGTLMNKQTGEPIKTESGETIAASTTFAPTEAFGSISVDFLVPAHLICGSEVVAFESLARNGREVAVHADLNDDSQTVRVPSLRTTLVGPQGTHEIEQGSTTLTDTVVYRGLCPDVAYTVEGTIVNKSTGEPALGKDGEPCVSVATFTPNMPNGSLQLSFNIDTSELGGESLVAFEVLHEGDTRDGREVARHTDIDDEDQTVIVPHIFTTASNTDDSSKSVEEKGTVRITDAVTYAGLTPNNSYVMEGTLHDKDTGKEITDAKGKVVTSTTTFVPQSSDGSVNVDFELEADRVSGSGIVVYETCLREGRVIVTHGNLDDENQTVMIKRSQDKKTNDGKSTNSSVTTSSSNSKSKSQTPLTGDSGRLIVLACAFSVLGTSMLVVQRWLRVRRHRQ